MSFENKSGLNVHNHYGTRDTGGSIGVETSDTSTHNYSIAFTGESLNSGFLPPVTLPKGSRLVRAILRVDQAFSIASGGLVAFGGGAADTNAIILTKAELEAIGTKVPASTGEGTWATNSATGTTAAERIGRLTSGAISPTQGKATLILTFVNKTKV